MDLEATRKRMANLSDEDLLEVIGPKRDTYRPEAIEIAEEELASRSLTPIPTTDFEPETGVPSGNHPPGPPAESGSKSPPPPSIPTGEPDSSQPKQSSDELKGTGGWLGVLVGLSFLAGPLSVLFAWIAIRDADLIFGLYAVVLALTFLWQGLGLNNGWHRAVQASILVLLLNALVNVAAGLLSGDFISALSGPLIPIVWIFYLRRSRRVFNTYPGWREFIETSGDSALRQRWLAASDASEAEVEQ
mgnify:CR=1 FL=1